MLDIKWDFPIFANNPGLVFLDSASSAQKPQAVIDGVSRFISHDYANIHRGQYSLSERSDELYHQSKGKVAHNLGCKASEIFYSYNATYCINIIARWLAESGVFQAGDMILVGIWDHHANIVPWQMLAEKYNLQVEFIQVGKDFGIDREDFAKKYTDRVKVVAVGYVSNVTGQIYDIQKLSSLLREETFLLVDGSQAVPYFAVDVEKLDCDGFVFTGHKVMWYTGIGAGFLKKERIKKLCPVFGGGGSIKEVTTAGCSFANSLEKFEPGTPDIIGAVSLLKCFEYIEQIWGYKAMQAHEDKLIEKSLSYFSDLQDRVQLLGSYSKSDRVWIFSFSIPSLPNIQRVGEFFAEHAICVRCGGHCAHPLHQQYDVIGSARMSLYVYNSLEDVERFFIVLWKLINT